MLSCNLVKRGRETSTQADDDTYWLVGKLNFAVVGPQFTRRKSSTPRLSPLGGVLGWPLRMDIKTKDYT